MGYMHINNLKETDPIFNFCKIIITEKIDGTSANVSYNFKTDKLTYFSGCANLDTFKENFNEEQLIKFFKDNFTKVDNVTIYGECYGGKIQKMSKTYGDKQRFIVFDVKVGEKFVKFETVINICKELNLMIVPFKYINLDNWESGLNLLKFYKERPSTLAKQLGMDKNTDAFGNCPPTREGIVIRPQLEFTTNDKRVIVKFKNAGFSERKSKSDTMLSVTPNEYNTINDAVDECLTEERLKHVLSKLSLDKTTAEYKDIPNVINLMCEDIIRECKDAFVKFDLAGPDYQTIIKVIKKNTATLFKKYIYFN